MGREAGTAADDAIRKQLESDEERRLAPWAMRSALARRALKVDPEGRAFDYRTEFQRDRDRILHARAFRRLRLKSAGGALPPSERYRDRLTHTLEVSQLARTVARGLALNEDLVEAIALGHELGMPPFAGAGADALNTLLSGAAGGFRVSAQSLRVADRVEKRYTHAGLNLTDATREGLLKQSAWNLPASLLDHASHLRLGWPPHLEAQVVASVEAAASAIQELDDGLRAGEIDPARVERLPITRELSRRINASRSPAGLHMRANVLNRGLTHMLVTGLIHHSRSQIRAWARKTSVESHEAFLKERPRLPADLIGLTPAARALYDGLCDCVARHLHQGAWVSSVRARAAHLIAGLFRTLMDDPRLAEDYLLLRFKEEGGEEGGRYLRDVPPREMEAEIRRRYRGNPRFARLVADHIAGMTDLYLISEHERLVGPFQPGGARS